MLSRRQIGSQPAMELKRNSAKVAAVRSFQGEAAAQMAQSNDSTLPRRFMTKTRLDPCSATPRFRS
jgi:hypothetical protein